MSGLFLSLLTALQHKKHIFCSNCKFLLNFMLYFAEKCSMIFLHIRKSRAVARIIPMIELKNVSSDKAVSIV